MKLFGKHLNRKRLKWWLIILATRLFGRRIQVEGSPKKRKVLPFIWKGKLYLFGMEHFGARVIFDSKYSTRIVEAPWAQPHLRPDRRIPPAGQQPSFCHVLSMHYPKAETEAMLRTWQRLAGGRHRIILAYGGKQDAFEAIDWPDKFFVPQSEIWAVKRGGALSYTRIVLEAGRICLEGGHDGLLYSDGDAWPTAPGYLDALCQTAWREGFDFCGPRLRDVTHSSYHFDETQPHTLPGLERWVRKHGLEDPNAPVRILTHLGALKYLSSHLLRRFVELCGDEPPLHNEMALPTYAHYLGGSYCDFDHFGTFDMRRWYRYRPPLEQEELKQAMQEQIPIIHPIKNNEWISLYTQDTIHGV